MLVLVLDEVRELVLEDPTLVWPVALCVVAGSSELLDDFEVEFCWFWVVSESEDDASVELASLFCGRVELELSEPVLLTAFSPHAGRLETSMDKPMRCQRNFVLVRIGTTLRRILHSSAPELPGLRPPRSTSPDGADD